MTVPFPTPATPLKIGTRGSPLALAQAHETRARLMQAHDLPQSAFEIVEISVKGDRIQDKALRQIGGKGLFTKEIEDALLEGSIDIAVHSSKDMPVEQPQGLALSCFLPREDVRDAFVSPRFGAISELPEGATVGTSSTRRRAQLLNLRPDLKVVEFRGNVQTRLRKLEEGVADATFLAMAGLNRLGHTDIQANPLSVDDMLPAVAQGAIGIEHRTGDDRVAVLLARIHDPATNTRLVAERSYLHTLDGSCQSPIAGLADLQGDMLRLRGEILSLDGQKRVAGEETGPALAAADIGAALARRLLDEAGPDIFAPAM